MNHPFSSIFSLVSLDLIHLLNRCSFFTDFLVSRGFFSIFNDTHISSLYLDIKLHWKISVVGSSSNTVPHSNTEKSLIVLSAPSVDDEYYSSKFIDILNYMINFANLANGKDEVVILANTDTLPVFEGKVPSNILVEAIMNDIWIRDFTPLSKLNSNFHPLI
jgi:hypothetical protein